MLRALLVKSGVVAFPLLVVSILLFGFIFSQTFFYFFKHRRKENTGFFSSSKFIEPLAGIAVSLGLLGSVTGFIRAFSAFNGKLDPNILTSGLSEAYYSTAFGLVLSIAALTSSYLFSLILPHSKEGAGEKDGRILASN